MTDTSKEAVAWRAMQVMEPEWFELRAGDTVLQIYSNWDEDAWLLVDASDDPDAEPQDRDIIYQHGSLAEVQAWGLAFVCSALLSERDALRAQLQAARDEALEEAAEQTISNAGSWEDVEGDAAVVISEQIRALKSTRAEGEG